ncbi:hypothetical protein BsWGS_08559 [Bradybaena similaris]
MISFPGFVSIDPSVCVLSDKAGPASKHQPKGSVLTAHNISYKVKVTDMWCRATTEKQILSDVT